MVGPKGPWVLEVRKPWVYVVGFRCRRRVLRSGVGWSVGGGGFEPLGTDKRVVGP